MKQLLIFMILLCATPSARAFEAVRTRQFVFYACPEDRTAAEYLARTADATLQGMAAALGLPAGGAIEVYVVQDIEKFYRARPDAGRLPSWAAGAAWPEKNLIVLLPGRGGDIDKTFLHEMNHILLGRAFQSAERVPHWLSEGLAMIWADEWSLQRLATMTMAALSGKLLPMDELADHFPADLRTAEIAYCQSFYFISFLKQQFGSDAFQHFFLEYTKYKDFKGAVRLAYQMDWEDLEKLWRKYIALHFSWLPLITSTSTLWFLATLLCIAGYIRKKHRARHILRAWQQEEACSPDTLH